MVTDPEQQLYKDMADLTEQMPKLQREVKSLKTRLAKLISRIDRLELIGLQDQLTSLGDEQKQLKSTLDETAKLHEKQILKIWQSMYAFKINDDVDNYSGIINHQLSRRTELISQLLIDATNAKTNVLKSSEPNKTYAYFKKEWDDKLKQLGVDTVMF